jgi:hypothetical protein
MYKKSVNSTIFPALLLTDLHAAIKINYISVVLKTANILILKFYFYEKTNQQQKYWLKPAGYFHYCYPLRNQDD